MASTRKRRRLVRFLARRAAAGLGDGAPPLTYVCAELATGRTIAALARDVARHFGEPLSRRYFDHVVRRLTPDARVHLRAAYRARDFVEQYGGRDVLDRASIDRASLLWCLERMGNGDASAHLGALRAVQPAAHTITLDDLRVRRPA